MFVALALVVALERDPNPMVTLLAMTGTVIAFAVSEVYDAAIATEISRRHRLLAHEFRGITVDQSFVVVGAVPAIVIFICASVGLLSTAAADSITVWTGAVLLACLGFMIGRLAGLRPLRCVVYGAETGLVGMLIVALKVLVKLK